VYVCVCVEIENELGDKQWGETKKRWHCFWQSEGGEFFRSATHLEGGEGLAAVALLRADVDVARLGVRGGATFLRGAADVVTEIEFRGCCVALRVSGWSWEGCLGGESKGHEPTCQKQKCRRLEKVSAAILLRASDVRCGG
jgi:hypothetical protein